MLENQQTPKPQDDETQPMPKISERVIRLAEMLKEIGEPAPMIPISEFIEKFEITDYADLQAFKEEMAGFIVFESTISGSFTKEMFEKLSIPFDAERIIGVVNDGIRVDLTQADLDELGTSIEDMKETIGMPASFKLNLI